MSAGLTIRQGPASCPPECLWANRGRRFLQMLVLVGQPPFYIIYKQFCLQTNKHHTNGKSVTRWRVGILSTKLDLPQSSWSGWPANPADGHRCPHPPHRLPEAVLQSPSSPVFDLGSDWNHVFVLLLNFAARGRSCSSNVDGCRLQCCHLGTDMVARELGYDTNAESSLTLQGVGDVDWLRTADRRC